MNKVFHGVFCVVMLLGMTWSGGRAQDDTVTVGATILRPFVMVDEQGEQSGLVIDLLDKLAEVAGLQVEYMQEPGASDELIEGVASGAYQVGARCLYVTPERQQLVDFTDSFLTTGPLLVTKLGNDAIQDVDDLMEETKVGVSNGGAVASYAQENLTGQMMEFAPVDSERGELLALVDGQVEVAVVDYTNAVDFIQRNPDTIQIVGDILVAQECTLAVSKDQPELLAALNDALAQIKADGSLDAIIAEWFGIDQLEPMTVAVSILHPFVTVDANGEMSGLSIDLLDRLAEVAGYQVEYVEGPSGADELVAGVADGAYQVAGRCLYATAERQQLVDFTNSFLTSGPVLVTKIGNGAIQSVADLTAATKVGVSMSSSVARYAQANLIGQMIEFAPVGGERGELLALVNDEVDVAVVEYTSTADFIKRNPDKVQIVGDILMAQECTLAVSKDSPELLTALNDALAQIKADGSLDAIINEWLGIDLMVPMTAGVVVVGPPVGFKDANGDLAGFGVDVVKAVAKAADLNVEFIEAPSFTDLVQGVAAGAYDLTAVCIYKTPARAELIDFSDPYQPSGIVLVTAADNQTLQSMADVTPDTTIGVVEGTAMAEYAANVKAKVTTYKALIGQIGLLEAVAKGEVDAALNDFITAQVYSKDHPGAVQIVGEPVVPEACHIGVSKDASELLATVNDALAQIKADGSLAAIAAEWLGSDEMAAETTKPGGMTMTIVEEYSDFVQIDLGEEGDSNGDIETWTSPLMDESGTGIGKSSGMCITSDLENSWYECQWTFHLAEGTLTVVGTETDQEEGELFELPVVGGTGKYTGAHGILRGSYTTEDEETYLYTYELEIEGIKQ